MQYRRDYAPGHFPLIMRRANFPIPCHVAILYLLSSMPHQAHGRLSLFHVIQPYDVGSF